MKQNIQSTWLQHLYVIERVTATGKVSVYKYGISGGRVSQSGLSYRAQRQVNALNRQDDQYTYRSRIIGTSPTRAGILQMERVAVTEYARQHGGVAPPANIRPKPRL